MDKLKGEVISVVFTSDETGFTVARLRSKQEPGLVTVVGNIGNIAPGTELSLEGHWKIHPKFGRQFHITNCVQHLPATIVGIKRYLSSGMIKGIGPVIAERMIDEFGTDTLKVLEECPEDLLKIQGIGKKVLKKITSSWEEHREVRNIILFLQEHGVPPSYAVKIYKTYGKDSFKVLKERPYDIAYDIRGIGFKTADKIALRLGFSEYSIERVQAAIVYVLFNISERGHVFYPKKDLIEEVCKLIEIEDKELILNAIELLVEKKRIHIEDITDKSIKEAVYLRHFYKWELEIASRLNQLLLSPPIQKLNKGNVASLITKLEEKSRIKLSEEQKRAVLEACLNPVHIITGGPGTGKTTITRFIGNILKEMGYNIKLAAPTGRAAKRLSEATGLYASTIHRLLGFGPGGDFQYKEDRKLKVSALVLDEVSMVDYNLFVHLLRALPLTCKLILIGDVNQLPSVGPGNILEDLIKSEVIPTTKLTKIYRQAKKSMIVINAHRINEGKFPIKSKNKPPEADFFWVEEEDPKKIQELILYMTTKRIPEVYGYDPLFDIQVLTPMHKGDIGTVSLNKLLQDNINPLSPKHGSLKNFRLYDRVIQTKNNYEKEVFNGDLGIITYVDEEEGELVVSFDGKDVLYHQSELDEISLAYCISIHKSQGSEYPVVLFPVTTQHFIMLHKNLIYTALTRAKKLAVIFGSKKAMAIALKDLNREERYTNLINRLKSGAGVLY